MSTRIHTLAITTGVVALAWCVMPIAAPFAAPVDLKPNSIPDSAASIRPLLPPDSMLPDAPAEDPAAANAEVKAVASQGSEGQTVSTAQSSAEAQAALPGKAPKKPAGSARRSGDGTIGIEVQHNVGVDTVALNTGAQNPKFSVQQLENPPRLVVDIESVVSRSNRSVPTKGLEYVSNVRVGAHPNKSRVVLDLTGRPGVSHEESVVGGAILVTLRPGSDEAAASGDEHERAEDRSAARNVAAEAVRPEEDLEERLAAVRADDRDLDVESRATSDAGTPKDLGTDAGIEVAKIEEPQAQTVLASLEKDTQASMREVTKLSLNKGEGAASPEVRVSVGEKSEFRLERTAPSEYVLTVVRAKLSGAVKRDPIISDASSTAIRSVRPTTAGEDVLLRIFTQPSAYLTAHQEKGEIVVGETHDLTQVVKDIRAQLAPPGKDQASGASSVKEDTHKDANEVQPPTSPNLPQESKDSKGKQREGARAKGSKTSAEMTDADIDALLGDKSRYTGRLISLDLQETDIDNALRIIAEVSNLNIVASEDVKGKVTLRLLDVPWDQALDVILKTNGLDKVLEGSVMRIAPVDKLKKERENLKQAIDAEQELEPLSVKYLRVSYAKAAEIKSLVETVLSERGSVAYDERSNQLIVKDVRNGLKNVVELVAKVDLRTPQVLLETQIVESSRSLARELGSELGFQYIQSPSTGNGTGLNFPSAISVGGSLSPNGILGSAFPAATSLTNGSAVSMLFDSADGTKSLELRLSQLEQEGRVRIISRPAVATTNNKAAEIKSVEKFRVKLPNGGLSVATGSGAQASGTGSTATEVIEAGITLNVTPQASPDYYILLDIKARSSTFGTKTVEGIPNEFERSASSTVLVSSGQTFALGGIYKVTEADNVSGVPFFKDIPVIGTFFRRSVINDSDEELLFFITPRIVEGSFDDATMKTVS